MKKKVFFGFQEVKSKNTKKNKVAAVFHDIADKYDIMNDILSLGMHRLWKRKLLKIADIKKDSSVLDIAAGSGDLSLLAIKKIVSGEVIVTDINESMLNVAKKRFKAIKNTKKHEFHIEDMQNLSFQDNRFDVALCGFGIRNSPDIKKSLDSMLRVLKPEGKLCILEFSQAKNKIVSFFYNIFSFHIIPFLGRIISKNESGYRYLIESIRKHPNQEEFKQLMIDSGFKQITYKNLIGGIVTIHVGIK
jgi:demethylmenaquinone methyltransferase/2-methoxy-6-polyprenyl-1,4-benzoquinol methylase